VLAAGELGPALEHRVEPASLDRHRRNTWAMGTWGSLAMPARFPMAQLSRLIAQGG